MDDADAMFECDLLCDHCGVSKHKKMTRRELIDLSCENYQYREFDNSETGETGIKEDFYKFMTITCGNCMREIKVWICVKVMSNTGIQRLRWR